MAKGTPDDPIIISDPSEARANLCYLIKPPAVKPAAPKEKPDGKTV